MLEYILIGLAVVLVICIIYWLFFYDADKSARVATESFIQNSTGVFDGGAQAALRTINRIRRMTPGDHYLRGNIIYHNLLDNDLRRDADVARVIINDFRTALNGMIHVRDPANRNIVDNIEMIYNEQPRTYNVWDHITAEDIAINLALGVLGETINNNATVIRKNTIDDRVAQAKTSTNSRADAANMAFDDATTYTNNPQNVHDSKVNSDLRSVLSKMKSAGSIDIQTSLDEIRDWINNSDDPLIVERRDDAIKGLNKARESAYITTYDDHEDAILAYTWERCKHPRNASNSDLMKDAVVTSLIDGIENDHQVCINGRCARVLNSLATLDFDDNVANGALTLEAYRNQIFQEVKEIVNREIDTAKESSDEEVRAVGEAYETGDELDNDAERRFKNNMKSEIDYNLSKYDDKLSIDDLEKIKQECYAYATI